MYADGASTGGFPEEGDQVGVAPESYGILFDPTNRQRLVPQSHVARSLFATPGEVLAQIQEAERAHAVLHRGDDDVAGGGDDVGVVDLQSGGAAHVAPAVDPDQDRHLGPLLLGLVPVMADAQPLGDPDVQVEAVFGDVRVGVPHLLALEPGEVLVALLVAGVGQLGGVEDTVPGVDRHRPPEAQLLDGRLREGDSREDVHFAAQHRLGAAPHQPAGGLHDEGVAVKVSGLGRPRRCLFARPGVGARGSTERHREPHHRERTHFCTVSPDEVMTSRSRGRHRRRRTL